MICIKCGNKTKISNSRAYKKLSTWRRRKCESCDFVFTTREKPDLELSLKVKVDNSKKRSEPFSEQKLYLSIYKSMSHRNDSIEASKELLETVINMLTLENQDDMDKSQITSTVYEVLLRFDEPAAVYYKAHSGR